MLIMCAQRIFCFVNSKYFGKQFGVISLSYSFTYALCPRNSFPRFYNVTLRKTCKQTKAKHTNVFKSTIPNSKNLEAIQSPCTGGGEWRVVFYMNNCVTVMQSNSKLQSKQMTYSDIIWINLSNIILHLKSKIKFSLILFIRLKTKIYTHALHIYARKLFF